MHEELQKKLDCHERIKEIKSQLDKKSVELKELQAELHHTEEQIRHRKRKVASLQSWTKVLRQIPKTNAFELTIVFCF